jgi:hypothetical protein
VVSTIHLGFKYQMFQNVRIQPIKGLRKWDSTNEPPVYSHTMVMSVTYKDNFGVKNPVSRNNNLFYINKRMARWGGGRGY